MADRRMIWRNIAVSDKVNKLSLKAALLWTWAIPFFDVKGYIETTPGYLKATVLPRRKDVREADIPKLVNEIHSAGLWLKCDTRNGKNVSFDPKFQELQRVRESHEGKSQLAEIVTKITNYSSTTVELPHSGSGSVSIYAQQRMRESFEEFWSHYPKKRSKQKAWQAWKKIEPDEQLVATMIATIKRAKTSAEWKKEKGKYIPYPSTWLNAHGWLDEYEEEKDWLDDLQDL